MRNYYLLANPIAVGILIGGALSFFSFGAENQETEILLTAQKLIKNGSPILGNPSAAITILEWGDYQCTFCFRFHGSSLKIIEEDISKQVK